MSDLDTNMTPQEDEVPSPPPRRTFIEKVPEYHGQRDKLDAWLLQCDLHFHVQDHIENDDKGTLAASRLRGEAFKWIMPQLQQYMDDGPTTAEIIRMFEDWDCFKQRIRQVFGLHKETVVAERNIQELRQQNSVANYVNEFRQNATLLQWNDEALKRMFRQGLKPQVREELMRTNASISNLDDLIEESIRVDDELYQLRLETTGHRKGGQHPNQGRRRQDFVRTTQTTRASGYYTSPRPEPMHLDSVTRGWKVDNGKGNRAKEVVCYGCGKKGHFARDCRSKNKVTRHLNVIGHQDNGFENDNEPWEIVAPMGEIDSSWDPAWLDLCDGAMGMNFEDTESNKENIDPFGAHPGDPVPGSWDVGRAPEPSAVDKEEDNDWEIREATMGRSQRKARACKLCRKRRVKCTPSTEEAGCQACVNVDHPCEILSSSPLGPVELRLKIQKGKEIDAKRVRAKLKWEELKKQEEEGKTIVKCVPPGEDYTTIHYDHDYRNPHHAALHWTFCTYDYCDAHYEIKVATGRFPTTRGKCKWQWYDCQKDVCKEHLWDKRTTNHFPGHDGQASATRNVIVNEKCNNEYWQTCMNVDCRRHGVQKYLHGFEEKSFLERNKQLGFVVSKAPELSDYSSSAPSATSEQELSRYQ